VVDTCQVRAPTAVGALRKINETLRFSRVIAVIVNADEISVLVEGELLEIADAGGSAPRVSRVRSAASCP
jgi:hypothetical protein